MEKVKKYLKNIKKSFSKLSKKSKIIVFILIAILALFLLLTLGNKKGKVETRVKSSLEQVVEKSNLETVNFTYNVIAKQCKDNNKCDKKSNDIDDFEYVVSCQGTVTAGINFDDVILTVDENDKKIIVSIPDAEITDSKSSSLTFLNGDDVPASEYPNANALCFDTVEEKAKNDKQLLVSAREQAKDVLHSFYSQWLKTFDEEYVIEFK